MMLDETKEDARQKKRLKTLEENNKNTVKVSLHPLTIERLDALFAIMVENPEHNPSGNLTLNDVVSKVVSVAINGGDDFATDLLKTMVINSEA